MKVKCSYFFWAFFFSKKEFFCFCWFFADKACKCLISQKLTLKEVFLSSAVINFLKDIVYLIFFFGCFFFYFYYGSLWWLNMHVRRYGKQLRCLFCKLDFDWQILTVKWQACSKFVFFEEYLKIRCSHFLIRQITWICVFTSLDFCSPG